MGDNIIQQQTFLLASQAILPLYFTNTRYTHLNLGLVIAVVMRERKDGRFTKSIEGAGWITERAGGAGSRFPGSNEGTQRSSEGATWSTNGVWGLAGK